MRIAVDLVYFTGRKGGTETYARALVPLLAGPGVELVGLVGRELRDDPPAWFPGETVVLPVSGENRVAWALAENTLVPAAAWRARADVLWCPANFGPAVSRVPVVLTVHDVLAFRHPELVGGGARGVQALTRSSLRGARAVLTDSQASADDLTGLLGVAPGALTVVPLAGPVPLGAVPAAALPAGRPFLLSTGNRLPHKNYAGLLRALAAIPAAERPRLVVPGSHGADPLRGLVAGLGLADDVDLRGWVDAAELDALYAGAAAYVLPSRFEGFGLPVLEAMARGCPVVCSDLPVLREVGGDAAVYVDTTDPAALAAAVRGVLADPARRARLAADGLVQAGRFSWDRVAAATLATLRAACA